MGCELQAREKDIKQEVAGRTKWNPTRLDDGHCHQKIQRRDDEDDYDVLVEPVQRGAAAAKALKLFHHLVHEEKREQTTGQGKRRSLQREAQ